MANTFTNDATASLFLFFCQIINFNFFFFENVPDTHFYITHSGSFFVPLPLIIKKSQQKDQFFSQGIYCYFFLFTQIWEHFFGLFFTFFFAFGKH
jgi:hypothetical protein